MDRDHGILRRIYFPFSLCPNNQLPNHRNRLLQKSCLYFGGLVLLEGASLMSMGAGALRGERQLIFLTSGAVFLSIGILIVGRAYCYRNNHQEGFPIDLQDNLLNITENYNDIRYQKIEEKMKDLEKRTLTPSQQETFFQLRVDLKNFQEKYSCIFSLGILEKPIHIYTKDATENRVYSHVFSKNSLSYFITKNGNKNPINNLVIDMTMNKFEIDYAMEEKIKENFYDFEKRITMLTHNDVILQLEKDLSNT